MSRKTQGKNKTTATLKKILAILLAAAAIFIYLGRGETKPDAVDTGTTQSSQSGTVDTADSIGTIDATTDEAPDKDGSYTSKEDVAAYINAYGCLPQNFITKNEAKKLGWDSSQNYLSDVAPGKSIGGDRFGNYEGLLPEADGRSYTECDIDYTSGKRNGKRIVFSNDGLIYYTDDHYETFELLYGDEGR